MTKTNHNIPKEYEKSVKVAKKAPVSDSQIVGGDATSKQTVPIPTKKPLLFTGIILLVVISAGWLAFSDNSIFKDEGTNNTTVEKVPTDQLTVEERNSMIADINKKLELAESNSAEASELYDNKATLLLQNSDYENAIIAYEAALASNGDKQSIYSGLGIAYYKSGQIDKAISAYQELVKINSNTGDGFNDAKVKKYNVIISRLQSGQPL